MRYKLRQESEGAFVFDALERLVFAVTQAELDLLGKVQLGRMSLDELPDSLKKRQFFQPSGEPDFYLISPQALLRGSAIGDFLSAPNRIYIEVTHQCNLNCLMCYNAAGRVTKPEWTTAELRSLLDEMERIGVFEARLTGGEPTQRSDLLEILDYAISKRFYVSLATNGVWSADLAREISRRRLDDVIISLEGAEEINDQIRGGDSFQNALRTVRTLKENGIRRVRINTVLSRLNWREVEPLFRICRDYDLLLIDFIHPRPFGRGADPRSRELMLTAEETYDFNLLVKELRERYPTVNVVMDFDLFNSKEPSRHPIVPRIKACPAGREFAFVSPQGNVFPCGVAPVHNLAEMSELEKTLFVAGNIFEQSLLEIWHNSPTWEAYRDLAKCKPPKCFTCRYWGKKCFGTCPVGAYYHTGSLNGEDPYCYSHLLEE